MKYKLIVFDLNETLINTEETWDNVIPRAISNNYEFDKIYMKKISLKNTPENYAKYRNVVENSSNDFVNETVLFDGVEKVLFELKKRGIKMAILNGSKAKNTPAEEPEDKIDKKEKYLLDIFDKTGISNYINDFFLGIRHKVLKPSKEAFMLPLKHFKIDSHDAIMVGDREKDMMAKNFGYTTILFMSSFSDYMLKYFH